MLRDADLERLVPKRKKRKGPHGELRGRSFELGPSNQRCTMGRKRVKGGGKGAIEKGAGRSITKNRKHGVHDKAISTVERGRRRDD